MEGGVKEGSVVDEFEILERIGAGAFSRVHLARHIPTGTYVAAKIINLAALKPNEFAGIMREVSVFMQVSHPHVCMCYRLSVIGKELIFFIEYATEGSLLSYVNQRVRLSEAEAQKIFMQIFETMRHLHIMYFLVHRDLKLENILINIGGDIKITDFGLSSTNYCNVMRSTVGTPGYTPPEVLAGNEYDEKCDVWSLGICLYAMLTGNLPFSSQSNFRKLIEEADSFRAPPQFSPAVADLLERMLQSRPAVRPRLAELAAHPWLRGCAPLAKGISPTPLVFYQVGSISDICKFKRRPQPPDESAVESAAAFGIDSERLRRDLADGLVNASTATYFALLHPLRERPAAPVQKPPHTVRVPRPRRNTLQPGAGHPRPPSMPPPRAREERKGVYRNAAASILGAVPPAPGKRRQAL